MLRRRASVALALAVSAAFAVPRPASAQVSSPSPPAVGELVPFWLVRPDYPHIARGAAIQGVVIVAVTVGPDGRVASVKVERDIPLLSEVAVHAAKDSGFICRGCTGAMTYRLAYAFGFAGSFEELAAARADVTPTGSTLRVLADAPDIGVVYGLGSAPTQELR